MRLRRNHLQAFTLLEILISLFIVVLLMAVASLRFETIITESKLEKEAMAIQLAARKALRKSVEERRTYTLVFDSNYFSIGKSRADVVLAEDYGIREDEETLAAQRHLFKNDIVLRVRRWGQQNWRPPLKRGGDVWVFEPSGICEPLSLRLDYKDSYVEMTFNPLTAHVEEDGLNYVVR